MRIKFLTATAIVVSSFSPAMIAPAYAWDVQSDAQAVCEAALDPNESSDFQTEPTGLTTDVGEEFLQSSEVLSSTPGDVLLNQISSYNGTLRVNGGSPNIHGDFDVVSTFSGGSSETLNTYAQTTTYTFGCRVFKVLNNGTINEPNGLQIPYGLSFEDTQVTRTETETVNNPNYDVTTVDQRVVCISPGTNKGSWRAQNGYAGQQGACSRALYDEVRDAPPPPTNSLPSS